MSDWQYITNEKEKYAAYLCSREWAELRRQVHERAGGVCERCERNPIDAVHHKTYIRKYHEDLGDLQAICNPCHEFTHGRSDEDPRDDGSLKLSATLFTAKATREGTEVVQTFDGSLMIDGGDVADQSIGLDFKIWVQHASRPTMNGIGLNEQELCSLIQNLIYVAASCGTVEVARQVQAICEHAANHLPS